MPARASTKLPANRSKTRDRTEPESDLEILSYSEDGLTFEGRLFGEETFTFSTDCNAFVTSNAAASMAGLVRFFHHLISIDHLTEGKTQKQIDLIAFEEKQRFDDVMSRQRNFTFERFGKLFGDVVEATGNDESEGNAATST